MIKLLQYAACASIALALANVPLQARPKFKIVQVPGAQDTYSTSINTHGDTVGWWWDGDYPISDHGFLRSHDGVITVVDVSGATSTVNSTINRTGSVAGSAIGFNGTRGWRGFVRTSDGTITTFQSPKGTRETIVSSQNEGGWIVGDAANHAGYFGFLRSPSGDFTILGKEVLPIAINSAGTITGYLYDFDDHGYYGFVRTSDGVVTRFNPGSPVPYVYPLAINKAGVVAGYFETIVNGADVFEGFTRAADGTITNIIAPGDNVKDTWVSGINNGGEIVGMYDEPDGSEHAFVRSPEGTFTTIDVPGAAKTGTSGINDVGQITGSFELREDGPWSGFLWTP